MRRIVHLVDDLSPGGVTRFLDYVRGSDDMAALGSHSVLQVDGGFSRPPVLDADVIVSHVVLSWRNLPFFLGLRARYASVPIVHMEHSYSPAFVRTEVRAPARFRTMMTVSLSLFDGVVTISTAQRDWLVRFARLAPEKAVLIPPCVDLDRFLEVQAASGSVRRIGALGRLDRQKGFDILIQAFRQARLTDAELHIFGDGAERSTLVALAEGDPRIVFHGHVDDPVGAVASVDALAMPSRREPYGLVALEAMAAGRPLLVSRADGLIDHAAGGALAVDRLTVEDWAAALSEFTTTDHTARVARARALAKSAAARFVDGWRRLLEGL
ncbi:MAG: glycosyltransferase [Pseudomonadota bacterium]